VPQRGKRNRPAWVTHVGERLAALHDVPVEAVRDATAASAAAAFGLVPPVVESAIATRSD
jgi:Tat protein secretion system quality control protein TatD with DNase activity